MTREVPVPTIPTTRPRKTGPSAGPPSRRALLRGLGGAALAAPLASCGFLPADRSDTLTFMFWGSIQEEAGVRAVSENFSRQPGGREVDPELVSHFSYQTKMNTLIAARQEPDIAYLQMGMSMRLGEGGLLVNMLDHRDRFPQLDDFLPEAVHYWNDEAAVFQTAIEVMSIWYNTELFDAAGLPAPPSRSPDAWTWDEFVATAERLTLDHEGRRPTEPGFDPDQVRQFGTLAPTWSSVPLYALLRGNGADLFDEAGTRCVVDSAAAVEVFTAVSDLIYEHRVAPSPTELASFNSGLSLMLRSGRVAMAIDGYWNLLDLSAADFPYGVGVMPRFGDEPLTTITSGATGVFRRGRHQEQAVEFYLQMADPELCPLYAQGLWMPLQRRYYTDPDLLALWSDTDIHPPNFVDSVVEPLLNHAVQEPTYRIRESAQVFSRLDPALDPIWLGHVRGRDEIARHLRAVTERVTPYLQGVYPDVRREA
ncbi:extracellular solute-binding protein [Streptomyces sp. 8K308]|uniref:extracellular solute-binding protein n=1 Tax=Streptomyces sp. 8K308 TaxID=2530388 RepID=UPI0010457A32|nr:extracellular solute-binding protein [Streptomyces sp. 8K308]TDC26681.1 extracellular solute-binding protein [Streptomyces sp. 8K308]